MYLPHSLSIVVNGNKFNTKCASSITTVLVLRLTSSQSNNFHGIILQQLPPGGHKLSDTSLA